MATASGTILGLGTDIVEIERLRQSLARTGEAFLAKVYTPDEQAAMPAAESRRLEYLAGRWAAKEAFSKALGTGMCADCAFVEIEVLSDDRGKPFIRLLGATEETARRLGVARIHVSISHERELATAFVVLEGGPDVPAEPAPATGKDA